MFRFTRILEQQLFTTTVEILRAARTRRDYELVAFARTSVATQVLVVYVDRNRKQSVYVTLAGAIVRSALSNYTEL